MTNPRLIRLSVLSLSLALWGCGSGGGGGSNDSTANGGQGDGGFPATGAADQEVKTYATTGRDGSWARVDLVNGGTPVTDATDAGDPGLLEPNPSLRAFLKALESTSGVDLDGDYMSKDPFIDGIPVTTAFETYTTGLAVKKEFAARIFGANNLYDLFQTTTGAAMQANPLAGIAGGPPFNGGDGNGDLVRDGGPGLFSNMIGTRAFAGGPILSFDFPTLPTLPNTMGGTAGTSGQGPSATDEHQFIQIEFPYNLDTDSLFNPLNGSTSFYLGDQLPGPLNVILQKKWVQRPLGDASDIGVVTESALIPCVAIAGGVTSIPLSPIPTTANAPRALIDVDLSNLPEGCKARVMEPNVLTLIAHPNPTGIPGNGNTTTLGSIQGAGVLVLPDPTSGSGPGGFVFGASTATPTSVNDFDTDGVTDPARRVGFVSLEIKKLRTSGKTISNPYFHTFPVDQSNVGDDDFSIDGSFDRGPAIEVTDAGVPRIDVLNTNQDYLSPYDPDATSDDGNRISTQAYFRVDFDREVIPNSVGFSRRHTIHSVGGSEVFRFNGNTRPVTSPATSFVSGIAASPLAPSIYLAVNQPTIQAVNNPYAKQNDGNLNVANPVLDLDNGDPIITGAIVPDPTLPGLYPAAYNTRATLPRGVVPVDIYPINQNNLQSYIVQPLVELPEGSVVTLGVCRQGLGMSDSLPADQFFPIPTIGRPTNHGNFTQSGTVFTTNQGLTATGIGDSTTSTKALVLANHTLRKVNAGPMDLSGNLFFGGTTQAIDTLVSGTIDDDLTDGGWNVSRTFVVGNDGTTAYVNAPVAPEAMIVGMGANGLGVIDLNGVGFTTNAPGGGLSNAGYENTLITTRFLPPSVTGKADKFNWNQAGSLALNSHVRGFGIMGRYTSSPCFQCASTDWESELALGQAIPTGFLTPFPGVNEGSSGRETMVRDSKGSQLLTKSQPIGRVTDVIFGAFLDTVYYDADNPYNGGKNPVNHRTFNEPQGTAGLSNLISDPPTPNPPPLRFPLGLPHTSVQFDQSDLTKAPILIEGTEVFSPDTFMRYETGDPNQTATAVPNGYVYLNPTSNASNVSSTIDVPHLPAAGFVSPFPGQAGGTLRYINTGPVPKTSTVGAVLLTTIAQGGAFADPGGITPAYYQSRQQIGNFLFVTDGFNKKLHAINSNNMRVIQSLSLPDPYGLGITPDLDLLFVSNEGDDSVSVVDVDPLKPTFMTEITRIKVGAGPRAVAVGPDVEDVFVLNRLANSISIIDLGTLSVRKTITQSGINRPNDIAIGMREFGAGPAFQSGTYHGYISNGGSNSVLVYESGPSGQAGIGFDNVLGEVKAGQPPDQADPDLVEMVDPRGLCYDPNAPLDGQNHTVGCYVAHTHPITGEAMISRVAYTADSAPGQQVFNTVAAAPGFSEKVFKVTSQFHSGLFGTAYDVALPDINRKRIEKNSFATYYNLYNAGGLKVSSLFGVDLPRNVKYPLASNLLPASVNGPRWEPDRVYLAVEGGRIAVFDLQIPSKPDKVIKTAAEATLLMSYFGQ